MVTVYTRKIRVKFTKEVKGILDEQSKICNWLYNQLLESVGDEYTRLGKRATLLKGRNLRNYGTKLKKEYTFLQKVHSSVLKEPSQRLLGAYKRFFREKKGSPNYRSWKRGWYSLLYDEPNKGWELKKGKGILIGLGTVEGGYVPKGKRNAYVKGKMTEHLELTELEKVKTLRVVKQYGRYYVVFTIERHTEESLRYVEAMREYRRECNKARREGVKLPEKPIKSEKQVGGIPEGVSWVSLDPNHENLVVGVDNRGSTIRFERLGQVRYWDKKIDKIKAKRDRSTVKYKKKLRGGGYRWERGARWNRLNRVLDRMYQKRREQIKVGLYTIVNYLYSKYDLVIIGDYTPKKEIITKSVMNRSMLNQTHIGKFRRLLSWVAQREGKYYKKVNEYNTTRVCYSCGDKESKSPEVRKFTCSSCGEVYLRDINAALNIAKKVGYKTRGSGKYSKVERVYESKYGGGLNLVG